MMTAKPIEVRDSLAASAAFVSSRIAGSSLYVDVSLDPTAKWGQGHIQNSRYGMFSIESMPDGRCRLTMLARNYRLGKMRTQTVAAVDVAVERIKQWIVAQGAVKS